ncbi:MAG: hypothetical protein HY231_24785 [Acidobacteria bacterium]|nr:hypothetical protein [Acidobacteriota bacterium]
MAHTLDEVKIRLSRKYLGQFGVHGIGISRSQNAIKLYVDAADDLEASKLKAIQADAAPYPIIIVKEERPTIT